MKELIKQKINAIFFIGKKIFALPRNKKLLSWALVFVVMGLLLYAKPAYATGLEDVYDAILKFFTKLTLFLPEQGSRYGNRHYWKNENGSK